MAAWCREYRRKKREGIPTARQPYVEPAEKRCKICDDLKPINQFNYANRARGFRSSYCKKCQHKFGTAWRLGKDRKDERCAALGTTVVWFRQQLEKQGGVCALCHEPETLPVRKGGKARDLAIDHCHETGTIRGLLCFRCNTALHQLEKHGLGWADAAVAYLKQYARETEWT